MIYQFDTDDEPAAVAALLVYAVYRSRDKARFKISPDMWERIARFTKAAAKRATNVPRFLDAFMPRLNCGALNPRYMAVGICGLSPLADGSYAELADTREFLTGVLRSVDRRAVVDLLYKETAYIVLLVRDRIERERAVESELTAYADAAPGPDSATAEGESL